MGSLHRSARGTTVDMAKLKLANEETVVVGNMGINARGDKIGHGKQVIESRNQIMDRVYAVPSATAATGGYSPNDPVQLARRQAMREASNAKEIADLVSNLTVEITPTDETPVAPAPRGSLADSIAKSTTVTQEPIPDPRNQKPSGPSRI